MKNNLNTITIYCGSMFSGKTTALKKDLKLFQIAGFKTRLFKHSFDTRDEEGFEKTHDGDSIEATMVKSSKEILDKVNGIDIVGIDEIHFFNNDLGLVVKKLIGMGKTVVVAGLDMDSSGEPFETTTYLMGIANKVEKMHGVCVQCGNTGKYNHRFVQCNTRLAIGAEDKYKCLCHKCIEKEFEKNNKIFWG